MMVQEKDFIYLTGVVKATKPVELLETIKQSEIEGIEYISIQQCDISYEEFEWLRYYGYEPNITMKEKSGLVSIIIKVQPEREHIGCLFPFELDECTINGQKGFKQ